MELVDPVKVLFPGNILSLVSKLEKSKLPSRGIKLKQTKITRDIRYFKRLSLKMKMRTFMIRTVHKMLRILVAWLVQIRMFIPLGELMEASKTILIITAKDNQTLGLTHQTSQVCQEVIPT